MPPLTAVSCRQILPQDRMFGLCDAIIQSGREYSLRQRSPVPLMYAYYDTEYLGKSLTSTIEWLSNSPTSTALSTSVSR